MSKIKIIGVSIFFALLLFHGGLVLAIDGLIGHFDDTAWYGLDKTSGYSSISVDMKPTVWKVGSDGYYFAVNPYFSNGKNVYAGLQTNGYDGTKWVGKMAIFSVWDVTSGQAEPNGTGINFGGEGVGYSVRMSYNWQVGRTYRVKIYILTDASSGNRTWAASVTDLSTNIATRIGRIYVPVSYGKIHSPVTFHERYMGSTNSCSDLSENQIKFTNMTGNGSIKITSLNHYYKANVPSCSSLYWTSNVSGGYVSSIGIKKTTTAAKTPATTKTTTPTKSTKKVSKTPKPAEKKVETKVEPSTNQQIQSSPTTRSKSKFSVWKIGMFLVVLSIVGWFAIKKFIHFKKAKKNKNLHFPYDFDIHGPRLR